MLIQNLDNRKLALIYAHMIYRNTELEDYHSENVRMGDAFYAIIYKIVKKNISRIRRWQKVLASLPDAEAVRGMLGEMPPAQGKEFAAYALDMSWYSSYPPGIEWAPANLLPQTERPKDAAAFVLGGAFSDGCARQIELDDAAMNVINRDVHDRVYTLVCTGYFAG